VVVTNQKGRKRILRLHNVAYCPEFPTNIVSLQLLEGRGIDWQHREGEMTLREDAEAFGNTRRIHGQYVIEYNENGSSDTAHAVLNTSSSNDRPKRFTRQSRTTRQPAWASSTLWHKRMGHIGPAALSQLGKTDTGSEIRGPSTAQCRIVRWQKSRRGYRGVQTQISLRDPSSIFISIGSTYGMGTREIVG